MSRSVIASTRFNSTTWEENDAWRREHNWTGCIYGAPKRTGETIAAEVNVIVLEMHNDENRIKGIGLIRNKVHTKEKARIYKSDPNYNRYIYHGNVRVDRNDLTADEEKIIAVLDTALFKGATHSKRGRGIMKLPRKIIETKSMNLPLFLEKIIDRVTRE